MDEVHIRLEQMEIRLADVERSIGLLRGSVNSAMKSVQLISDTERIFRGLAHFVVKVAVIVGGFAALWPILHR